MTYAQDAAQITTGSDEAEAVEEIRQVPLPEEAEKLEIILPADLAGIEAEYAALDVEETALYADTAIRAAEIAVRRRNLHTATLRRLQITEELLRRERDTSEALRAVVEKHTAIMQLQVNCINAATDAAAAESHEASDYERIYREQYEHEPEPRDPGTPDPAADLERSLMMPPATSPVQVHYEAPADDLMPAFLRNLSRTDTFDEADVWAEPETPSRMIARGFRNLRAILDAMRNPFRQATPSRRIA